MLIIVLECVGTGIVVVGETRKLIASLPQDVTDVFTHRFTFGMMEESCRLRLDLSLPSLFHDL